MRPMEALPLDRFPRLRSDKLDKVRAAIWAHMGVHPIELIHPGAGLDAIINGRPIDRVAASYLSFGAEVRTEPGEIGFYLIQQVMSGTYTVRQSGQEAVLERGGIVVLSPDLHLVTRWSADCGVVAYQLRTPHVLGHLSGLLGHPVAEPLRFDLVMDAERGRLLDVELLRPLTHQLNRDSEVLRDPYSARRIEDTLLTGLLRAQPNTYSEVLERELGWPSG